MTVVVSIYESISEYILQLDRPENVLEINQIPNLERKGNKTHIQS